MLKNIIYILSLSLFFCSCNDNNQQENSKSIPTVDYTQYVNPFIGTSKMGHVFPGATTPFGMVQLSPQTNFEVMFKNDGNYNTETYEYCAGYQHKDSTIIGFAHTNFSGTGHSDLGDFLIMPTTGNLVLDPIESNDTKGFFLTQIKYKHRRICSTPPKKCRKVGDLQKCAL